MSKFAFLILFLFGSVSFANEGNEGTGGGDPSAYEFAIVAGGLAHFLNTQPTMIPDLNIEKMNSWVRRLRESLYSDSGGLIQVQQERPKDRFGVSKDATADTKTQVVRIHKETWDNSSIERKVTLVAMEILWMSDVNRDRYTQAMVLGKMQQQIFAEYARHGQACVSLFKNFSSTVDQFADTPCLSNSELLRQSIKQTYSEFEKECSRSFVPTAKEMLARATVSYDSVQRFRCKQ